jgi:hypothetical protein
LEKFEKYAAFEEVHWYKDLGVQIGPVLVILYNVTEILGILLTLVSGIEIAVRLNHFVWMLLK